MRATARVAIADADSGFVRVLASRLELARCEPVILTRAPEPLELATMRLSALVLDPERLGASPWERLAELAEAHCYLAVLACAAPAPVAERVKGLRAGLDDWVAKPCHPEEIVARLEAILRRHRRAQAPEPAPALLAGALLARRRGARRVVTSPRTHERGARRRPARSLGCSPRDQVPPSAEPPE